MRRSRGVRSFTTVPPMRISPAVGVSSPAIMRRSVVLPEPEGPSRTRNSPSRLSRSTSRTAPTSPFRKVFVSFRVSTMAISGDRALFPLVEDPLDLLLGGPGGFLGRHLAVRGFCEHRRDDERVEDFVDTGRGIAGVAHVRRPVEHVRENLVFLGWNGLRVVLELLGEIGHRTREAG